MSRIHKDAFVHESSYLDDNVSIGSGTKIWHFSHILSNCEIARISLGQNVVIGPNVSVGNRVKIQNNVSVYEGVTLEDGVFVGHPVSSLMLIILDQKLSERMNIVKQ